MMVVVATDDTGVAELRGRLVETGGGVRVMTPTKDRRLVLTVVDDDRRAERLAAELRAEGWIAVTRPEDGPRLEGWMRHTEPTRFGDRLSVCFAWSEHDRADLPGLIELGAGGFGSGQHPATSLLIGQMVSGIVRRIEGGERVLDVGCGSGVLGLCALRLGASNVVAVDVKPAAVEATLRNAELNGFDHRVEAGLGPLGDLQGRFDVVLANVGRSALVELAPELVRLVSPNGWLAVSGFSPSQCDLVAGFVHPLVEVERATSGEWAALVLAHP